MKRNTITRFTESFTLEELGKSYCSVDFQVEADLYPEEPRVMYFPDGSGYPGCPAQAELTGVRCERFESVHGDEDFAVERSERPDWFRLLDEIIRDRVERDWDEYQEQIFEAAGEVYA